MAGRFLIRMLLVAGSAASLAAPSAHAAGLKAPSLQTPAHEAHVESIPAFRWAAVKGADRYEFQLSADSNFGSIVGGRGRGSFQTRNTAAAVTVSAPDGTYWWRVRAIDAKGKAGSWSRERTIDKAWSTAPQLVSPVDGAPVTFPSAPLVLKWSSVPRTYKYRVFIASDPELGSLVIQGPSRGPVETSATVFAPGVSLPPGRYYWAVQTVDSAGHRGARSAVGSFMWSWPTGTATSYQDLVEDPRLADPRVSWNPIPGAVAYEVEVNRSEDFAVGSRVCLDPKGPIEPPCPIFITTGTSLTPLEILPNNVYHWRVRAIDADGNSGQWNVGPNFDKNFGDVPPTVQNLRVADNLSDQAATDKVPGGVLDVAAPVIRWDPVPGAASYDLTIYPVNEFGCDLTQPGVHVVTAATGWTPVVPAGNPPLPVPGDVGVTDTGGLSAGTSYCIEIFAYSGNSSVRSDITQLGSLATPAFRYDPDPVADVGNAVLQMTSDKYLSPVATLTPRLPVYRWTPITGAASYWVFVARDSAFTNIVDVALTRIPAYVPRKDLAPRTYRDEDTPYYWAVLPAHTADGGGVNFGPVGNAPRAFEKRSVAPARMWPADGADITDQPVFRWRSGDPVSEVAEGAESYRLQVAVDPSFGELVDDVTTQGTSYTAEDVYPADTVLYWRVRVTDVNGVGLAWSTTGTFRRRLQAPSLAEGNLTAGSIIPALQWNHVQGAISYDVHVDQSDGTRKDFNLRGTAFTPTTWYGTGVWRWQVRANFPNGTSRVSSAYTGLQSFARRIPAPEGVHSERSGSRMLLSWDPVFNAKKYRVEFSNTSSFSRVGQIISTENLSAAPDLGKAPFLDGGQIFWRVAALDEGDNVGGYAAGEFRTARRMRLRAIGRIVKGKTVRITVTATDPDGDAIRKAKVRVSGVARARAKRTGKKGTATFKLRARRRGTVIFRATRGGYQPAEARIVVR